MVALFFPRLCSEWLREGNDPCAPASHFLPFSRFLWPSGRAFGRCPLRCQCVPVFPGPAAVGPGSDAAAWPRLGVLFIPAAWCPVSSFLPSSPSLVLCFSAPRSLKSLRKGGWLSVVKTWAHFPLWPSLSSSVKLARELRPTLRGCQEEGMIIYTDTQTPRLGPAPPRWESLDIPGHGCCSVPASVLPPTRLTSSYPSQDGWL